MAYDTNDNPHDLGIGILMPALAHRWQINFSGSKKIVQPNNILRRQAVSCKLDMLNNTAKIAIEQSILGEEYYQLKNLFNDNFSIRIDSLNGGEQINYALLLHNCKIIHHDHNFDYADGNQLFHNLTIKYFTFEVLTPSRTTPEPV